jgi:hypothetical protein
MEQRLQQAIGLAQQAVGQLQGMFKRLAAKMEQDVRALGSAAEKQARDLAALTRAHNALVDEVAGLREELVRARGAGVRPAARVAPEITVRPNKPAPALPPAYNGCKCVCHTTPGIAHPVACCAPIIGNPPASALGFAEPEDAVWYEGDEEHES